MMYFAAEHGQPTATESYGGGRPGSPWPRERPEAKSDGLWPG